MTRQLPYKYDTAVEYYKTVTPRQGPEFRELRKATFLFQEGAYVRLRIQSGKFSHKEIVVPETDVKL